MGNDSKDIMFRHLSTSQKAEVIELLLNRMYLKIVVEMPPDGHHIVTLVETLPKDPPYKKELK
jgi:hypothetical protein